MTRILNLGTGRSSSRGSRFRGKGWFTVIEDTMLGLRLEAYEEFASSSFESSPAGMFIDGQQVHAGDSGGNWRVVEI